MLGSSLFVISGYQAVLMHLLSLDLSQKLGMRNSEKSTFLQKLIMSQGARICLLLLISGVSYGESLPSWQSTFLARWLCYDMKIVIPSNFDFTFFGNDDLHFFSVGDQSGNQQLKELFNNLSEFDEVSANYEEVLSRGISLSGEKSDYFARNRVDHTAKLHSGIDAKSETIMDYGCGTGGSVGYLLDAFNPNTLIALDTSDRSLQVLKQKYNSPKIKTENVVSSDAKPSCDLLLLQRRVPSHFAKWPRRSGKVRIWFAKQGRGFSFLGK